MSSLNPIVGVSLCIGALGAGLAYLAYNNDEENDEENDDEVKPVPEEVKPGPLENETKKTNMQQFLQDTYEKTN